MGMGVGGGVGGKQWVHITQTRYIFVRYVFYIDPLGELLFISCT